MTEFRKQYQNEPVDFHLWSQDKIAEFWWKAALEMVLKSSQCSGDNADVFWDTGNKRYVKVGCSARDIIRKELGN